MASKGSPKLRFSKEENVIQNEGQSILQKNLAYDTFEEHIYHAEKEKELRSSKYVDTFFRKTTKFLVLPSNCLFVKKMINSKIPEFRFDGKTTENLANSGSISNSVYFDTPSFDYYDKRILQVHDSMLFRFRWYSNKKCTNKGFMEQKVRKPGWRSEASIKQRFQIEPHKVFPFFEKGKSIANIDLPFVDQMHHDSKKWGNNITHAIRTTYRRTVFQEYNSAPVRISFDEDCILTDVSNMTWDEAIDPTLPVSKDRQFLIPLGILEIKLAFEDFSQVSTLQMPDWVYVLQNSNKIMQVAKFSKYCSGVAIMNIGLNKLQRVPSWINATKKVLENELSQRQREWFGCKTEKSWTVEDNKNIPLICEAREYMANERTLLKWVRMCFLAMYVGLGLLGFEYEPLTPAILIVFSLIILCRSYYMYYIRLQAMLKKEFNEPFYDSWGPPLIVALFVLPTLTYLASLFGLWNIRF